MQDQACEKPQAGAAAFAPLHDDADRRLRGLGEKRKDGKVAKPVLKKIQERAETIGPVDHGQSRPSARPWW